jgi:predicted component of type VI protein secretion system
LGYSCEFGGCRAANLTIPNITSIIDGADLDCTALAALAETAMPSVAESNAPGMDTSAPTFSPAPLTAETMDETLMPSVKEDSETTFPSTEEGMEAPTSEPINSGGFSMNKVMVASILVAATTMFAG